MLRAPMGMWAAEEFVVESAATGARHAVAVATPHGYHRPGGDAAARSYPLVLCLDAHWLFGTVRDLAVSLSMGRLVPRVVVAGVGWPTSDLAEVAWLRHRDATPTRAAFPGSGFGEQPGRYGTGGAARFRRFLLDELRPLLARRYRLAAPAVLVGHSLTGLFGVHTLLHEPDAFDAYLLASPSLWWDDGVTLRETEPAVAAARDELPTCVYLSVGAEVGRHAGAGSPSTATGPVTSGPSTSDSDARDSGGLAFGMIDDVEELARRLGRYRGLALQLEVLPGETHHSTLGQSVSRGLRALLGPAS
jgi:predicted alpha/beta superfamily hydrolase